MHARPHPINAHKLARLIVWAQLLLMWWVPRVAAWALQGRPVTRADIDPAARALQALMVTRALARLPPPPRARHRHGRLKHVTDRIAAGSYFRRQTRGANWAERMFALLAFMRDAERHIARQVKRLRQGLTRLRVILPRAEACALPAPAACTVAASDTS